MVRYGLTETEEEPASDSSNRGQQASFRRQLCPTQSSNGSIEESSLENTVTRKGRIEKVPCSIESHFPKCSSHKSREITSRDKQDLH
jgi:hypothetical protein